MNASKESALVQNPWWTVSSNEFPFTQESQVVRYIILVFYLGTFIFGLCGNSLVLYIIAHFKNIRRKSIANYYIWNLSLADLLFVLTMPFFCYATFTSDWPFGEVGCKVAYVLRETNRFASVFLLSALSMDRYLASFTSPKISQFRTIRAGCIICIILWVMSSFVTVPFWIHSTTIPSYENKTSCQFLWPAEKRIQYKIMWTYFQLFTCLIVPSILMSFAYISLTLRVRGMFKTARTSNFKKPGPRMTKTSFAVVLMFMLCQTPYHIVELVSLYKNIKVDEYAKRNERYTPPYSEILCFIYLNGLAQVLVFVSSCCNPIVYGLLNENYRKYVKVTSFFS